MFSHVCIKLYSFLINVKLKIRGCFILKVHENYGKNAKGEFCLHLYLNINYILKFCFTKNSNIFKL